MKLNELILDGFSAIEEAHKGEPDLYKRQWDLLVKLGKQYPEQMRLLTQLARQNIEFDSGQATTLH